MASFKPQTFSLFATIYLPVISLALLMGFALSLILPVALSLSIAATESVLFIRLPQLWHTFLSWITPPCLFVLLNSIIVVLTANSGMLSSSGSSFGSSDFYSNFFGKMESSPKQRSEALMEDLSVKIQFRTSRAVAVEVPNQCTHKTRAVLDVRGTCQTERGEYFDATGVEDEDDGQRKEVEYEEEVDTFTVSRLGTDSRSLSLSHAENRILEEEAENDEYDHVGKRAAPSYGDTAMVNKRLSLLCKEGSSYVQMSSRSVPASPKLATPPMANSIKRSLSVDSASLEGNRSATLPSAESLSDEAFKRRVEEFISRMNAQIRNGPK